MDRITSSLLQEFLEQNGIIGLPEEQAFEHFTGYIVVANHHYENFSSDDIHVGAGGDCGIDCIGVIVNGCLVTEPEEIEDLVDTNGYLDVVFVFIQSERSSSFDTAKIGQFGFGVIDILSEQPRLPQNEQIQLKVRIINEIYKHSTHFRKGNPQCYLYYATTGRWTGDQNLKVRSDAVVRDLENLNIFRNVFFRFVDADKIQTLYRDTKNALSKEIVFSERTVLPDLPGIEQAFIGFLSVGEFFKLVENDNQEIITSIFYDNVRHWQDWNPVNSEIRDTLENPLKRIYFPLFNNGITVVAKHIRSTANRFTVEDYQIVNGCQTSYVLHESRSNVINENIIIPIRLIATEDPDIRNSITKATNRQTEVSEEQLFALEDFPKKLEAYFPSFNDNRKLFYERRSRQYNSVQGIEKVRIISITTLVRAFASMFLELPHTTTRNYKALVRKMGTEIFNPDHRLEMYYISAYSYYRLEYLFRSQALPAILKPARFHILMAYRMLANPINLPAAFNSHEMERFCNHIMENLWDETQYRTTFGSAANIIQDVANGNYNRDNIRTEPFTVGVKAAIDRTRTL